MRINLVSYYFYYYFTTIITLLLLFYYYFSYYLYYYFSHQSLAEYNKFFIAPAPNHLFSLANFKPCSMSPLPLVSHHCCQTIGFYKTFVSMLSVIYSFVVS